MQFWTLLNFLRHLTPVLRHPSTSFLFGFIFFFIFYLFELRVLILLYLRFYTLFFGTFVSLQFVRLAGWLALLIRAISLVFPANFWVPICHNDSFDSIWLLHLVFFIPRSNTRNWIAVGRHVRHKQHNPTLNLINGQATHCCRYCDDDHHHHHQLCWLTNSEKD